jgi:integrase
MVAMTSACIATSSRNSCRNHWAICCGDQWQDHGLVFASEFGTPIDPRNILRTIQVAAQKAACPTSGCTRCAIVPPWPGSRRGVHIKAMADLLGHSSIAITGDIYGHTSDNTARAAVEGLAGQLGLLD